MATNKVGLVLPLFFCVVLSSSCHMQPDFGEAIPDPLSALTEDALAMNAATEIVITGDPLDSEKGSVINFNDLPWSRKKGITFPPGLYSAIFLNVNYGPQNRCKGNDGIGKLDARLIALTGPNGSEEAELWRENFEEKLDGPEHHRHLESVFEQPLYIRELRLRLNSSGCHPDNFRLRMILRKHFFWEGPK